MVAYVAVAMEEEWWSLLPRAPLRGRVTSSFARALNVDLAGRSLSILTRTLGRAPGAILVAGTRVPAAAVGAEILLAYAGVDVLSGGAAPISIDIATATRYSAQVTPAPCRGGTVTAAACAAAHVVLRDVARTGSFLVAPADGDFHRTLAATLRARAATLQTALAAQLRNPALDGGDVRAAAARLIGLGVGLTPSGDDYLVGCLAVLHQTRRGATSAAAIGAAIAAAAVDATTAVSRSYLRAAAAARFHEDLAAAAGAGLRGDVAAMEAAFTRVAEVGATSGTDSLHGVVDTVTAMAG